jgi:hypothetical protein
MRTARDALPGPDGPKARHNGFEQPHATGSRVHHRIDRFACTSGCAALWKPT